MYVWSYIFVLKATLFFSSLNIQRTSYLFSVYESSLTLLVVGLICDDSLIAGVHNSAFSPIFFFQNYKYQISSKISITQFIHRINFSLSLSCHSSNQQSKNVVMNNIFKHFQEHGLSISLNDRHKPTTKCRLNLKANL